MYKCGLGEAGSLPMGKLPIENQRTGGRNIRRLLMQRYYYIGLDVHKKCITYCVKLADGKVVEEGVIRARRSDLLDWAARLKRPWIGGMEATLFTGWVYDVLKPHAVALKVAHPLRVRAIVTAKKKNDRIDAATLSDLLRCDLFPACYMVAKELRDLRRVLRYRNLLVREAVRMKNKVAGLLMEAGVTYDARRLHGRQYFHALLGALNEVPDSVVELLRLSRSNFEIFQANQKRLVNGLVTHPDLRARVERLMTIPGVGEGMALTWALEVGEPQRFSCVARALSYCGLCSAQHESAGKVQRGPLSKQRNHHLQTMLIEAAKVAPRWNPHLAAVYERHRARGANPNRATLAVARKLVAYLLAVDKSGQEFTVPDAA